MLALIVNLIQSSLQAGKKSLRGCLDQLGLKARLRSGYLDERKEQTVVGGSIPRAGFLTCRQWKKSLALAYLL